MVDFNINLLIKSNDAIYLRDVTSELFLKLVNHEPTHFRTTLGTWMDAIFLGCNDTITDTEEEPAPYHNHHILIGVTFDIYVPKPPCESFTYRAFNTNNSIELNTLLRVCDWSLFNVDAPDLNRLVVSSKGFLCHSKP